VWNSDDFGRTFPHLERFVAELGEFYQDYFTRVADRLNSGQIIKDLPTWICRNTRLRGEPFSFKDHEFQIEIARDQTQELDVMKCSQVGLTELQVRLILGYLSISAQKTAIYVMPHSKMAIKFTKGRIDTIIDSSATLTNLIKTGTNSAELKQLGDSLLYVAGAESESAGISVPADALIFDEYDFCNQRVIGQYSSRVRHAMAHMIKRRFSTPTVSNFGIARNYEAGSKKRYFVKCRSCNQEQAPDFRRQVTIPGFDKDFLEFDRDDLNNPHYNIAGAYLRCDRCGKSLDASLAITSLRRWVAEFPHRPSASYAVKPFDLISHNSTASVIRQIKDYTTEQDYWNFVQGEPHDTDENKINDTVVESCCTGEYQEDGNNYYIGLDVGKVCHYIVGKKINGKKTVVGLGKLRITDGPLTEQAIKVFKRYGFIRGVIDSMPDISIPAALQDEFGHMFAHPAVYVKGKKQEVEWFKLLDETGFVNLSRTKCIDSLVQSVNRRKWIFPRIPEMKEVRKHLQQMVRIERPDDEGEITATWVKSTDHDHYFHALIYLNAAMEMDNDNMSAADMVAPMGITGVIMGQTGQVAKMRENPKSIGLSSESHALAGLFGRIR
jgi:hypothetical protein